LFKVEKIKKHYNRQLKPHLNNDEFEAIFELIGVMGSLDEKKQRRNLMIRSLEMLNWSLNMKIKWMADKLYVFIIVPDRRRRILLKVVLVRRWVTWVLGI
jgi:hypothetical protein